MRTYDFLVTSRVRLIVDEERRAWTEPPLLEDKDLWIMYRAAVALAPAGGTDEFRREFIDAVLSHPSARTAKTHVADGAAAAELDVARTARRARGRALYTAVEPTKEHAMKADSTLERTTRTAGAALVLVGFVVAHYVIDVLMSRFDYVDFHVVEFIYDVTIGIAIPLGAGLLAASLVIRSLTSGANAALVRAQLAIAFTLIAVGLLARAYGSTPAQGFADFLGPTGTAGAEIGWFVLGLLTKVAIPLGVALAAVWPIQRWVLSRERTLAD